MKRKRYPKISGQPMDILRRRRFDRLRKLYAEQIQWAMREKSATAVDVAAWNCAFLTVAEN